MGIVNELMLILPHMEFETPELKKKYLTFMTTLDQDMDNAGFDTASNTDDMFESLKDELEGLENAEEGNIIVELRIATEDEQAEIDKLVAEQEETEELAEADMKAKEVDEDVEDEEEVSGTVIDPKDLEPTDDDFEQELQEEVAEQVRLEEIKKAATGEISGTP